MSYAKGLIQGLLAGAVLTYVFDPQLGRTRRVQLRDKAVRASHEIEDATLLGGHDLANRAKGVIAGSVGPRKMLSADEFRTPGGKLVLGAGLGVMTLLAATFGSPLGILVGGAAILGLARTIDRRQKGAHASAPLEANMSSPESTGGIVGLREAYGAESEWTPPTSSMS